MPERVAGVVLAAGAGRRFGMPKALAGFRGSLLVEHAAGVLTGGGCDPVLVVLGAGAESVRERAELSSATVLVNPDWAEGMASSLHLALDTLSTRAEHADVVAVALLPVDMPGLTSAAVARVAAHAHPDTIAAASFEGRRGHPVLLGRRHWSGARAAAGGDRGARDYLRHRDVLHVACDDIASGVDVDRPEDLEAHNP